MGEKIGYIQRRSRTITPEQQTQELLALGCQQIYEDLDDFLSEATLREDDMLMVWSIGIIGRVNITRAFLAAAKANCSGIYSAKAKRFYSLDLPHAQTIHDAYEEMKQHEDKVRSEATKGKSGRQPSGAWDKQADIRALADDGVHIDDLAIRFGASSATIRRIIK